MEKNLYLSSTEQKDFEESREVVVSKKLEIDGREFLLLSTKECLIGQSYGFGGRDIYDFYVTNRSQGESVHGIDKFPFYVYVLIPKSPEKMVPKSISDLQNIAWAWLYDNEADAKKHKL